VARRSSVCGALVARIEKADDHEPIGVAITRGQDVRMIVAVVRYLGDDRATDASRCHLRNVL
jgi:hypothetical protein